MYEMDISCRNRLQLTRAYAMCSLPGSAGVPIPLANPFSHNYLGSKELLEKVATGARAWHSQQPVQHPQQGALGVT